MKQLPYHAKAGARSVGARDVEPTNVGSRKAASGKAASGKVASGKASSGQGGSHQGGKWHGGKHDGGKRHGGKHDGGKHHGGKHDGGKRQGGGRRPGPRNVHLRDLCDVRYADGVDSRDFGDSLHTTPQPVAVEKRRETGSGAAAGRWRSFGERIAVFVAVVVGIVLALGLSSIKIPEREQVLVLDAIFADFTEIGTAPMTFVDVVEGEQNSYPQQTRADAKLVHVGYRSIPGGVVYTPETLSTSDGSFDLLIHFHGNVKVVVESVVAAKLNAAVAAVNLGTGSGPYQNGYVGPGSYEELLGHIRAAVKRQGIENPRLRRVALSSWSAGYGAISTILEQRKGVDPLDAILILDGIYVRYEHGNSGPLDVKRLAAFAEAADVAAAGDMLFTVTYSDIEPPGVAGSRPTAEYLLSVAKNRGEVVESPLVVPAYIKLPSMVGALAKEDVQTLEPYSDYRVGGFHIRGYKGASRGHHMAHLFQMCSTVLPELAKRWDSSPGYTGRENAVDVDRIRKRSRGKQ